MKHSKINIADAAPRNRDYCREKTGFSACSNPKGMSDPHLPELPDWLRAPTPLLPPSPLRVIHSGTLVEVEARGRVAEGSWLAVESLTRGMFGLRRPDLRCAGESGSGIYINLRGGAGNEPCWQGGEFVEGIVPAITALKKKKKMLGS